MHARDTRMLPHSNRSSTAATHIKLDFINLISSGYTCALRGLPYIHLKSNQTKGYIPCLPLTGSRASIDLASVEHNFHFLKPEQPGWHPSVCMLGNRSIDQPFRPPPSRACSGCIVTTSVTLCSPDDLHNWFCELHQDGEPQRQRQPQSTTSSTASANKTHYKRCVFSAGPYVCSPALFLPVRWGRVHWVKGGGGWPFEMISTVFLH